MTTKTLEEITASPITTTDPRLHVTMPDKKLAVGAHTFQLEVVDDSGNTSQPALVQVIVVDSEAPTAVLMLLDENGEFVADHRLPHGAGFILSGERSVDAGGGQIVKYTWSRVPV